MRNEWNGLGALRCFEWKASFEAGRLVGSVPAGYSSDTSCK